jgi:hypothetical protein
MKNKQSLEQKQVFSIGFYDYNLIVSDIYNWNLISCLGQVAWDINCKRQGVLDVRKNQQT